MHKGYSLAQHAQDEDDDADRLIRSQEHSRSTLATPLAEARRLPRACFHPCFAGTRPVLWTRHVSKAIAEFYRSWHEGRLRLIDLSSLAPKFLDPPNLHNRVS